jgi:hypothetical protein
MENEDEEWENTAMVEKEPPLLPNGMKLQVVLREQ